MPRRPSPRGPSTTIYEHEVVRAPLIRPLTPTEEIVVDLVGMHLEYQEIADMLKISKSQVRDHCRGAARKIPGDLPAQARVMAWARGATADVLRGDTLRLHVGLMAKQADRGKWAIPHSGGNGVTDEKSTDSHLPTLETRG